MILLMWILRNSLLDTDNGYLYTMIGSMIMLLELQELNMYCQEQPCNGTVI